ncbi:MAG: carboxypeptidase regulatory-like domain-containing protein [Verrucomicrobiota bacterium]|jgi:protocatechuate 3,4-dioxygenase beta subunit
MNLSVAASPRGALLSLLLSALLPLGPRADTTNVIVMTEFVVAYDVVALGARADTNNLFRCQARVVDATGQPVPGAVVERYRGLAPGQRRPSLDFDGRSTADNDGAVAFTTTNAAWFTLVAAKPGFAIAWTAWDPSMESEAETLTLTLTPPASVSGLVQDSAHQPVPEALVWVSYAFWMAPASGLSWSSSPLLSRLGRRYFSARTGPDGKFRIDALPQGAGLELAVSKPGLALDQPPVSTFYVNPLSLRFDAGQSNIVLTLKPAGAIEGRVVREDSGAPVAGANVALAGSFLDDDSSLSSMTGPDGAFRLTNLSPGDYTLLARLGTNQPPDLVAQPVTVAVESGATNRNVKLALGPGALLEVTVRDEAGNQPVKAATVWAASPPDVNESATTSDQGLARFRLPPGQYQVGARKPGSTSQASEQATLERNQTNTLTITLAAASATKLTGTLLDPDGKPAPNVAVASFPFSQSEKHTDAQGRFTLMLNPSQFGGLQDARRILIARDLKRNLAAALELEEDATNVTLRLEPGLTLAGLITDANGKPITNAQAALTFRTERMSFSFGSPTQADAQGRFEIKALPPARAYGVSASAKGFGQDSHNLEAPEPSTRRVELDPFQLPLADQRIAGVVVDADDRPVPGAWISSYGEKQPRLQGRTNAKGRFSFDHVCGGSINLYANNPREPGGSGSANAQGGDTNITIQLGQQAGVRTLRSGAAQPKLTGTVLDADGKPAPKVTVSLFPFFSYAQKRTDDQGRFTLAAESIPTGYPTSQRVLIARDPDRNLAAAFDLEDDTTNADLKLGPGLTLVGRVTDVNGHAVSNAQAQVMFRTDRMSSQLGQAVRADAQGRFEIKALPFGRKYSVTVSARGFGQDQHEAEAPEAGSPPLELDPFQLLVADQRIAGVVLDSDDQPVAGARLYTYGNNQPNLQGQTDAKGRFSLDKACAGAITISANSPRGGFGSASVEAGDTNITIRLSSSPAVIGAAAPQAASLRGKPLPDLAPLGLAPADAPAGQPLLALLIDAEQRPSRRALRLLAEQAPALKQKGLAIVILQAGAMADDAFAAWKQEAALPFPVARFKDDADKTRAAWGAAALPWPILTGKSHRVAAEGFPLEELDAKLKELKE